MAKAFRSTGIGAGWLELKAYIRRLRQRLCTALCRNARLAVRSSNSMKHATELPRWGQIVSKDVHMLVKQRFPGVVLESDIQGWAFIEEFEEGISAYGRLDQPTPTDDRWLGVCYFAVFRDMDALEALYRAVNRGEVAARINIAHLLRFVERGDEVSDELARIQVGGLGPYDEVLYFRVLSIHEENSGNLRDALKAAEEAWRKVQGIPEFPVLAPSILAQLAILHGRIGRSQRALWFLERGLQFTGGHEQLKIRLKRAALLANLGRYQEAQAELESSDLDRAPTAFQVERQWLQAEIAWSTGNLLRAESMMDAVAAKAQASQLGYEEFLCHQAMVAIRAARGQLPQARNHLTRAQLLISDRSDRLTFRFREVIFYYQEGLYASSHALDELDALILEFGEMGLLQEQCAVRLHKAAIMLSLDQPGFESELDQIQSLSISLQNHAFLAREWTLLPDLQAVARKTHPRIAGTAPVVFEVYTLGQERLVFDGKPVNIPLRRGVEVLAYFLEHKAVTLKKLLADVFPEDKPRSAKSYFHQFRHQLRETVDGLEIEYDGEAKMYRLKSEIDILWDVSELRAGRVMGETGLFLPGSGNDWALVVERGLDPYREAAGIPLAV